MFSQDNKLPKRLWNIKSKYIAMGKKLLSIEYSLGLKKSLSPFLLDVVYASAYVLCYA